jgi:hypothetical protein
MDELSQPACQWQHEAPAGVCDAAGIQVEVRQLRLHMQRFVQTKRQPCVRAAGINRACALQQEFVSCCSVGLKWVSSELKLIHAGHVGAKLFQPAGQRQHETQADVCDAAGIHVEVRQLQAATEQCHVCGAEVTPRLPLGGHSSALEDEDNCTGAQDKLK